MFGRNNERNVSLFACFQNNNEDVLACLAYGLTETASIVTNIPCGLTAESCRAKSGSVGVPLYNVQMKVSACTSRLV